MLKFHATFDDGELVLTPVFGHWFIVNEGQTWKLFEYSEGGDEQFIMGYPTLTEAHDAALKLT